MFLQVTDLFWWNMTVENADLRNENADLKKRLDALEEWAKGIDPSFPDSKLLSAQTAAGEFIY